MKLLLFNKAPKQYLFLFVIITSLLVSSCSNYRWGWYTVSPLTTLGKSNLLFLLSGLMPTISLSLVAFAGSAIIGLFLAILGKMKNPIPRYVNKTLVAVLRSVPVLVLLLWTYYGLPIVANVSISIFWAAALTMMIAESAFIAEIYRTGIDSVSKSQVESAYVFGANTWQVYTKIILPQVFVRMLPSLINQFIYIVKISSLASIIGYQELTRKANELTTIEYRPLEIYTLLILEYLVLILIISIIGKYISSKLGPSHDD